MEANRALAANHGQNLGEGRQPAAARSGLELVADNSDIPAAERELRALEIQPDGGPAAQYASRLAVRSSVDKVLEERPKT